MCVTAMKMLRLLASAHVMLVGCAGVVAALIAARVFSVPSWSLVTPPLALLGVNLAAAIATHPALRRGGLGVFHVALLSLLAAAGLGRLLHLDARIEMADGSAFDAAAVETQSRGPLHRDRLATLRFVQESYATEYAPGVKRGRTRSEISLVGDDGTIEKRAVGDDAPLVVQGYRLYTTHNKGFAPVVTWTRDGARGVTGALHMPSYPLFEHRQQIDWTPPGGPRLRLWLLLDAPLDETGAWRLDPARTRATLIVHAERERVELAPGEQIAVEGGTLRYERLTGWMGYRIFYDPALPLLLSLGVVGTLGLAWHVGGRLGLRMHAPSDRGDEVAA